MTPLDLGLFLDQEAGFGGACGNLEETLREGVPLAAPAER
jgi:hypothetical protein